MALATPSPLSSAHLIGRRRGFRALLHRHALGDRDPVTGPPAAPPCANPETDWQLRRRHEKTVGIDGNPANHLVEDRAAALQRHITLFNTESQVGSICNGIAIGMEEQLANGNGSAEAIQEAKVALIGPTSAIGDSLRVATIIPLLLTICLSISNPPPPAASPAPPPSTTTTNNNLGLLL